MPDYRYEKVDRLRVSEVIEGGGIQSLSQAIRVAMTAAASGSTGIQVPDDPDIDIGTNNFTVHWEGSLPDWTPAALVRVLYKFQSSSDRYTFQVNTNGTLLVFVASGGVTLINASSTVATGLTDGSYAKITASVIRETATAAGSVTFYVNGVQLGTAVSITAAATVNADNSGLLYISGDNTLRYASDNLNSILYNRALSAAEVLRLCVNGPALADIGASQTPVYTSNFSAGVDGFSVDAGRSLAGNQDGIDGEDDWATATRTDPSAAVLRAWRNFTVGDFGNVSAKAFVPSGALYAGIGLFSYAPSAGNAATGYMLISPNSSATIRASALSSAASGRWYIGAVDSSGNLVIVDQNQNFSFKSFTFAKGGITGQWNAENAQSNTGQIFDSSGNNNHALLPAAGATIIGRPTSQPQQVRWTNTWAGTNETQFIGGINQAILPAKAYIQSILGVITGATVEDITVGDGVDADRYVTITTGLAAGTTTFTLANRTTDGTNLKLTVNPDNNATMSIAWTITYTTLE